MVVILHDLDLVLESRCADEVIGTGRKCIVFDSCHVVELAEDREEALIMAMGGKVFGFGN